jgi:hypothetical protein
MPGLVALAILARMKASYGPVISRRQFLAGSAAAGTFLAVRPRFLGAGDSHTRSTSVVPRSADRADQEVRALRGEFADDFDGELAGQALRYWEALGGVTVLGRTRHGDQRSTAALDNADFVRGHGMVVALDGVGFGNQIPGRIRTVETFRLLAGVPYVFEFEAAGSHRAQLTGGPRHSVVASVPGAGATVRESLLTAAEFHPVVLRFTPRTTVTSRVQIASADAAGRGGVIVDNVRLHAA